MTAPGIYFGMGESEYHAIEALSNSGVKQILCSPMNFWASTPWLNPEYEEEESKFMDMGKAYHTRIVEGKDAFYYRYAPALDPDDYPRALRTMDQLREALPAGAKKGGSKADLAIRLCESGFDGEIWDLLVDKHDDLHPGKEFLSPKLIKKIEIAAAMIEKHPQLCKAFTGGYPEVSIVWNCRETGVPMKSRLDFLKTQTICELKTVGNPMNKRFDKAVTYAMASNRYDIQAAIYLEAVEEAKAMLADDLVFANTAAACDFAWLDTFRKSEPHHFLFVLQQTGVAPVARGYEFARGLVFDCAKVEIREAKETFAECMKTFGREPWIDRASIRQFDDGEFPVWMHL